MSVCLLFIDGQTEKPTGLIFDPLIQNFMAGNIGQVLMCSDLKLVSYGPK